MSRLIFSDRVTPRLQVFWPALSNRRRSSRVRVPSHQLSPPATRGGRPQRERTRLRRRRRMPTRPRSPTPYQFCEYQLQSLTNAGDCAGLHNLYARHERARGARRSRANFITEIASAFHWNRTSMVTFTFFTQNDGPRNDLSRRASKVARVDQTHVPVDIPSTIEAVNGCAGFNLR